MCVVELRNFVACAAQSLEQIVIADVQSLELIVCAVQSYELPVAAGVELTQAVV